MIIALVVVIAICIMIALYACCVASGRADEEEEKRFRDFLLEKPEPRVEPSEVNMKNKTAIVNNSFDSQKSNK